MTGMTGMTGVIPKVEQSFLAQWLGDHC